MCFGCIRGEYENIKNLKIKLKVAEIRYVKLLEMYYPEPIR